MQIITRWNHINERRLSSLLFFGVIFSQGEGGVECLRAVEDIPSGVEITISYRLNILDSSLVDENHYHSFWRIVQIANEGLRWRRTFQLGLSEERFWRRCSFYIPVEGNWLFFRGELFQHQWKCRHQTTLLRVSASSAIVPSVPFQPKRRSLTTMWGGRWDLEDNLIIIQPTPLSLFNTY